MYVCNRTEPLKQNDPALVPDIQKVGCFFRCALRMAEHRLGRELFGDEINYEWFEAKKLGYIDYDNNLKYAAKLATDCLHRYGGTGAFVEIATKYAGDKEPTWYSWVQNRRADHMIMKIRQNGPSRYHFVEVDANGNTIWDPHEPGITKTGEVYTVYYRFDEGKK